MTIWLTKDNFICNSDLPDGVTPITITDEQWQKLRFRPLYKAWKYNEETDDFSLCDLLSESVLRERRQAECFDLIDNKSRLWWDMLSESDYKAIKLWYQAWLNVTDTKVIPEKPDCIK